jgi:extracellular factor (EF) 3-hydroxypalmitic acid methyl ester biosynthesis protein
MRSVACFLPSLFLQICVNENSLKMPMEQFMVTTEEISLSLNRRFNELKNVFASIEQNVAEGKKIMEATYNDLSRQVMAIVHIMHESLSEASDVSKEKKAQIIEEVRRFMLPTILQTETTARFFTKPLGYAGDYVAIENIYNCQEGGSTVIGKIVDRMHIEAQTALAVRNRKQLIANELCQFYQTMERSDSPSFIGNTSFNVMSIASGPAREINDLYRRIDPKKVKTTLVDFDGEALDFCRQWIKENNWQNHISTLQTSIMNLMVGRTPFVIEPQNVVYSIGVIDYFQDKHVVKLLDYIHGILKPNGKVILGNFHKSNIFKEYMDNIMEWKLNHRSENDMESLLLQSKFGQKGRIFFEPSGLNMFLEGVKNV